MKATLVTAPGDGVHALLSVGPDPEDPSSWTQNLVRLAPDGTAWIPVDGAPRDLPPSLILVGADGENLIPYDRSTRTLIWCPLALESSSQNWPVIAPRPRIATG